MSYIDIRIADITTLEMDAIVNAANSGLWAGGGVCGAIFKAAGHEKLQAACEKIGHCDTGSAVITPGFDLKAKYIIHAVGPKWSGGKRGEPEQLLGAYTKSLELAEENGCASIAFPLISSGIYGYPTEQAWEQAILACKEYAEDNPESALRITFAVLNDRLLEMGKRTQQELYPASILREEDAGGTHLDYETAVRTITPGKYRHYKGN